MASTYQDAYTITDVINTQVDNTSVQYTSDEATQTLRPSSYDSSLTHIGGALINNGYSQKSLYEMCLMIQTDWDEAMIALDAEAGVGTTTYTADCSIAENTENAGLDGAYSADVIASLLTLGIPNVGKINLYPGGMATKDVAVFCQAVASMIAKCTALLDADASLTDIDYAITTAASHGVRGLTDMKFSEITSALTANFDTFDITAKQSKIKMTGIDQAALMDFFNTLVVNLNALWVKIDADLT